MTIRVGVIGVGWGAVVHVPAFRLVEDFDVVGLCGRSRANLQRAADATGITDLSDDWEAFVSRDDIDLISVATPITEHRRIALAAMEAGKHVLVEKPLALTAQDCADLVSAASQAAGRTASCFELRWTPERSRVRSLVSEGFLGEPFWIRVSQSKGWWHPTHATQAEWMYDLEAGGGYLNGMVSHDIDFVCSLFGRPVQVCADVRTSIPERTLPDGRVIPVTADDSSVLMLRMESGALAVLTTSVMGVHADDARFEAFGSKGTIVGAIGSRSGSNTILAGGAGDERLLPVDVDRRQPRSGKQPPARGAAPLIRAMGLMLEDWNYEMTGRGPAPTVPTLHDGYVVQSVIEAARRSAAGEGWVNMELATA